MSKWKFSDERPNGSDLGFQPGDRVELPHGGGTGTVVEVDPPEQEEDGTLTNWVHIKKDDGQTVVAADWMLNFIQGLDGGVMPDTLPWGNAEQDYYRSAGAEEFQDAAAADLTEYEGLARDIIKTLPPEDWPVWVRNLLKEWTWGKNKPVDMTPYPHEDSLKADTFPETWGKTAGMSTPANYTNEDPLDLQGKQPIFQAMDTQWWTLPPDQAKRAVVNAFRATMLSPRMNLKGNAVLYQSLMNVDPNESNPDVFENIIRALKQNWDQQGQVGLESDPSKVLPVDQILPGKMQPGIWTNIRRLAALGPYADELYKAALTDVYQYGGTGHFFRNRVLELNIPGVKAKVSSFAWLALAPMTSELGTIDVHMMRHLDQDQDSPSNTKHYMQLEDQLRAERDQFYPGTPLTQYQWGVWDKRRTPGFHQDHSPLKPIDPTPYTDVHWSTPPVPARDQRPQQTDPNQLQLAKVGWTMTGGLFGSDNVKWIPAPDADYFKQFVNDVMYAAGVGINWMDYAPNYGRSPLFPNELEEASAQAVAAVSQYHDNILRITKGHSPAGRSSRSKKEPNYWNGVNEVLQQLPVMLQNQIPTKDYRNVNDQEHANEFYNGILPNDPKMRSQYPRWSMVRLGGYSIQGQVVGVAPQTQTDGIAVRPDIQSREEIQQILDSLPGHQDDAQHQRDMKIPDYAINRGGKVADMKQGPSGEFTYAPGVIIVKSWVDLEDNWILYHDRCVGILAGQGGATSHGVTVARERNIPIIVNIPEWNEIQPGDQLQIDGARGIIHGNGGRTQEFDAPQQALEPVLAFVWSQGHGLSQPIPPGSSGAAILHRPMIRQLKQQGTFDKRDYALGVIYGDGRQQIEGTPSDEEAMNEWLKTITSTG